MKQYRVLRIAGVHYGSLMEAFYLRGPGLGARTYAEQLEALFRTGYVYSDSFSRAMRSLGHDAYEIVYDLEKMQKTWAAENEVTYDPARWQEEIVLKQVETIRPDVVYFQDIHCMPYSTRRTLKERFPFIRLVVVYKGYPGAFDELDDVDLLLVATPTMARQYQDAGLEAHLVYHAFDDGVLALVGADHTIEQNPLYDFTFVGSSGFGYGLGHQSRYWTLVQLASKTSLSLWVDERMGLQRRTYGLGKRVKRSMRSSLKWFLERFDEEMLNRSLAIVNAMPKGRIQSGVGRLILETVQDGSFARQDRDNNARFEGPRLPTMPLSELLPDRCLPPVFGAEMYTVLRQSRVTFNRHTDEAADSVGNMRLFQATGMGTCLLTDTARNMPDLFEEEHEVVTYSSIEECIEKVRYLLDHDDLRRQIAAAGQRRTLKDHTMMNRCRLIDDIIQGIM